MWLFVCVMTITERKQGRKEWDESKKVSEWVHSLNGTGNIFYSIPCDVFFIPIPSFICHPLFRTFDCVLFLVCAIIINVCAVAKKSRQITLLFGECACGCFVVLLAQRSSTLIYSCTFSTEIMQYIHTWRDIVVRLGYMHKRTFQIAGYHEDGRQDDREKYFNIVIRMSFIRWRLLFHYIVNVTIKIV